MRRTRVFPWVLVTFAATMPAAGAYAQGTGTYALRGVSVHPHGTAVAVALRLHVGSQDDPDGLEGTAWLLGRVLEAQVNAALDPGRAVFTAGVERATTVLTLLAEPSDWPGAWRTADSLLFDAPLDAALLEKSRAGLLDELAFESGSPFAEFEVGAAGILADPGSPFVRPPRGTRESVERLGPTTLEQFRSASFRRQAAALAVVGPVPPDSSTRAGQPIGAPGQDVPWTTGDRVPWVRDVTSTWIAVAWPVPSSLPRTHAEMVAHLLKEDLDPLPPAPDRYGVDVRIEETPRGAVLIVEASVFPESAERWEARILGAAESLAAQAMPDDFFAWRRRRFRAARLVEEAAPEVEAQRMSADLLRDGRVRDLGVEIWSLGPDAVRAAARALGPPRIFLLGPDLAGSGR